MGKGFGSKAELFRVIFARAFIEGRGAFRAQEIVDRRHRAIVQIRRGSPNPDERARLIDEIGDDLVLAAQTIGIFALRFGIILLIVEIILDLFGHGSERLRPIYLPVDAKCLAGITVLLESYGFTRIGPDLFKRNWRDLPFNGCRLANNLDTVAGGAMVFE